MTAIVNSGQRMRWMVSTKVKMNCRSETRIHRAESIAATKIPVPVAESQLNLKTAASAFPFSSTTGTSRKTLPCKWDTGTLINAPGWASKNFLTGGRPQANTHTLKSTQGTQAETIWPVV